MAVGGTAQKSKLAQLGFRLALLAAVIAILAVVGWRLQVMPLELAILGILGGAVFGLIAALLSVAGIISTVVSGRTGMVTGLIGLVLGALVAGPTLMSVAGARSVPPIHDITTDLQDPPQFVQIVEIRGPDANPLDRSSPVNLAALQQDAYPTVTTLTVNAQPGSVFEQATEVARNMGWDVVTVDPADGIIEATDTTALMGFKDDIVVRVREENGETAVDVRSVSRVGVGDMGVNAERIQEFLDRLRGRVFS